MERKSLENKEEAANVAFLWCNQLRTKKSTEDVITALDQQPIASTKTIQELIDNSVNKSLSNQTTKM